MKKTTIAIILAIFTLVGCISSLDKNTVKSNASYSINTVKTSLDSIYKNSEKNIFRNDNLIFFDVDSDDIERVFTIDTYMLGDDDEREDIVIISPEIVVTP